MQMGNLATTLSFACHQKATFWKFSRGVLEFVSLYVDPLHFDGSLKTFTIKSNRKNFILKILYLILFYTVYCMSKTFRIQIHSFSSIRIRKTIWIRPVSDQQPWMQNSPFFPISCESASTVTCRNLQFRGFFPSTFAASPLWKFVGFVVLFFLWYLKSSISYSKLVLPISVRILIHTSMSQ